MTERDVSKFVETMLASFALMAQIVLACLLLLALLAIFVPAARRALVAVRDTFAGSELWIAFAIALTATLGSLFMQYFTGYKPCMLCWIQRAAMYPTALLLLAAALRKDIGRVVNLLLILPTLGSLVSIYHIWIEHHPEKESVFCTAEASCSAKWIDVLGYITIPTLALTAFACIIASLLFYRSRINSAADAR